MYNMYYCLERQKCLPNRSCVLPFFAVLVRMYSLHETTLSVFSILGEDLAFLTIGLAVPLFSVSFVAAARPVAGLYEKASISLRRLGLTLIQRRVISCGKK